MPPAPAERLAHLVFFTLKDRSPEARDALVTACREYLSGHAGTVHFSAGPRAEGYVRPVNDQAFDVALVVVFESESDHDRYQADPRHQDFIAKHSPTWAQVRVFDAFV
jgi:hypothetical protein